MRPLRSEASCRIPLLAIGVSWLVLAISEVGAQPVSAGELFRSARIDLEDGEAWQAVRAFDRAIRLGYPKAEGYRALAEAYLALDNRLFEAREALERSLAADSGDVDTWYRLALVNLDLGGMDAEKRARRALWEVVRRDPVNDEAHARWRGLYFDREDARRMAQTLGAHLLRDYRPEIALRRIEPADG